MKITKDSVIDFMTGLAGCSTWGFVLTVPVIIGITLHRLFLHLSIIVCVAVSAVMFFCLFVLAEGIWRVLRFVFTGGETGGPKIVYTDAQKVANLISYAFSDSQVKFDKVIMAWPKSFENELTIQALNLLKECRGAGNSFDQVKLNQNLRTLTDIMNQLRS